MNVIFLSKREGSARQLNLAAPADIKSHRSAVTLGVLGSAFALGLQLGRGAHGRVGAWRARPRFGELLAQQKQQITDLKQQLQLRVDAMAMRLGEVNAHVIRLDALGKRLTEMANIDSREFNFDRDPPRGGPESDGRGRERADPRPVRRCSMQLEQRVDLRESQLAALENVILARELKAEIHPRRPPGADGFISSYFGERAGSLQRRGGLPQGRRLRRRQGLDVLAVAAGVVTWAGERSGYGKLVEINHGNGYVTRYAHNERTLVTVGETVKRGQPIALMGSTGRSTGPHVHFEVLRNGRQVDPLSFIGR